MTPSPIDLLIDALLDPHPPKPEILDQMIEAARRDIAARHAATIRSDVNHRRCEVRIALQTEDGLRFVL